MGSPSVCLLCHAARTVPPVGVRRSNNVTGTRTTGTSCPVYQVAVLLFLGRVVWILAVALCVVKFTFPLSEENSGVKTSFYLFLLSSLSAFCDLPFYITVH